MTAHALLTLTSPSGARALGVDLRLGGRVVSFSLAGRNVLAGAGAEIGSTFWPSPQSLWGWPPPPTLDTAPYAEQPAEPGQVCISSAICPVTGLQVGKRFFFEGERLRLAYTLINRAERALRVAPWEVTRVPGGLSFYPAGGPPRQFSVPDGLEAEPRIECANGYCWHRYEPSRQHGHYKLFGEGGPWLANYSNGLLFLKRFPAVSPQLLAPDQAAVEIYAHGDAARQYIELEQQGPWQWLSPDEAATWQVDWQLSGMAPDPDRPALLAAANAMAVG